jgi:hypothetical protein
MGGGAAKQFLAEAQKIALQRAASSAFCAKDSPPAVKMRLSSASADQQPSKTVESLYGFARPGDKRITSQSARAFRSARNSKNRPAGNGYS